MKHIWLTVLVFTGIGASLGSAGIGLDRWQFWTIVVLASVNGIIRERK